MYTLILVLWQKSSCTLLYYSNVQKTCRTTYIRTFNDNHRVHLFGVCGAAVFLSFSSSEERRFVKNEIINQVVLQIHCTNLHFDRILSNSKLVTVLIFDLEGINDFIPYKSLLLTQAETKKNCCPTHSKNMPFLIVIECTYV